MTEIEKKVFEIEKAAMLLDRQAVILIVSAFRLYRAAVKEFEWADEKFSDPSFNGDGSLVSLLDAIKEIEKTHFGGEESDGG